MQRMVLLAAVLFAIGAVPAEGGTYALPSPGCEAINNWDTPFDDLVDEADLDDFPPDTTFEVVENTSFFAGEVVTVTGTGGDLPFGSAVGIALQNAGDPDPEFLPSAIGQIEYTFTGNEIALAGAAFFGAEGEAECQPAPDADGDGIGDASDACPGTVLSEQGSGDLKNRYRVSGPGGDFVDVDGDSAGVSIFDTGGCSADQIGEALGLGKGHMKFGITSSALDLWLAQ